MNPPSGCPPPPLRFLYPIICHTKWRLRNLKSTHSVPNLIKVVVCSHLLLLSYAWIWTTRKIFKNTLSILNFLFCNFGKPQYMVWNLSQIYHLKIADICNGVQLSKFFRYLNLISKHNPLIMKTGLWSHNTIYCMSANFQFSAGNLRLLPYSLRNWRLKLLRFTKKIFNDINLMTSAGWGTKPWQEDRNKVNIFSRTAFTLSSILNSLNSSIIPTSWGIYTWLRQALTLLVHADYWTLPGSSLIIIISMNYPQNQLVMMSFLEHKQP